MVDFDWIQILVIIIEKECLRMNNERHLIFWLSKAKRISKTLFHNMNKDLLKKCSMYNFFFRDNNLICDCFTCIENTFCITKPIIYNNNLHI